MSSSRCPARRGCAAISSSRADTQLTVGIVGSARLSPPDPRCALAEQTGAAIAAQGWILLTGGYGGLMAAAAQGAAGAGGTVIGLPMRDWAGLTPNEWNHSLRWCASYPERLGHLLTADALIVLDGGIGTLSEAAVAWAALQTEPRAADLIFLGAGWRPVLESIASHLVVDDRDLAQVTVCDGPQDAVARIAAARPGPDRAAGPRG